MVFFHNKLKIGRKKKEKKREIFFFIKKLLTSLLIKFIINIILLYTYQGDFNNLYFPDDSLCIIQVLSYTSRIAFESPLPMASTIETEFFLWKEASKLTAIAEYSRRTIFTKAFSRAKLSSQSSFLFSLRNGMKESFTTFCQVLIYVQRLCSNLLVLIKVKKVD